MSFVLPEASINEGDMMLLGVGVGETRLYWASKVQPRSPPDVVLVLSLVESVI